MRANFYKLSGIRAAFVRDLRYKSFKHKRGRGKYHDYQCPILCGGKRGGETDGGSRSVTEQS